MLSFTAVALLILTAMWGGLTDRDAPTPYDSTDVGEVIEEEVPEWYDEPWYEEDEN